MTDVPGSAVPSRAKAVVIGGGIVGNSLLGWLAELGWTDIVQQLEEVLASGRTSDARADR